MGTWGTGLLDGDSQLDAIGEITDEIEAAVAALADEPASEESAGRLAGGLALLIQISGYSFESEEVWPRLHRALRQQASAFDALGPEAAALLRRLDAGEGAQIADGSGGRAGELLKAVGDYLDGPTEPALLASSAAAELVQQMAERCARMLDAELIEGDDLYEMAGPLGLFGLLLLLPPCRVDPARLKTWSERVRAANEKTKDERGFFDEYMVNVELGFEIARRRFGG